MGSRVRLTFGKFKGDALEDVPTQYLVWLLESEALYDGAVRRAVVLEVINRIAPEYRPAGKGKSVPDPEPRRTYDPGGVFEQPTGPRAGTKGNDPRPTMPGNQGHTVALVMREIVEAGYRAMARRLHPDVGGTHEQMVALNAAADALRRSLPR